VIVDTSLWHVAIVCYLAAMALDEIDFRSLLRGIAERRFERIAMSLGDGLVCAGPDSLITVWNPGAVAIFGYAPEEMIGQPFGKICDSNDLTGQSATFSLHELPFEELRVPGGKIMELEGRRKNGETFPLEACFSEWQGVDGFQYGAVMRDISARKREAERIRYLAEHDTLTDLANRNTLYEHLAARLAEATTAQSKVALLILDLDKFKQINDTLGHACGDQLLCDVAERLSQAVDGTSLVARLSGDEFAIVLGGTDAAGRAQKLAEQTCLAFNQVPFSIDNRQIRVNASIGVAAYPEYCATADQLFANADLALYRAKAAGRGRYVVFERRMRRVRSAAVA
jgi:diguanylate cyclase (GGDEF)-like protein/PAS domain S-box-containing protein